MYKAFPPGLRQLQVPLSSRRAARAGLALYSPCRLRGILLQRAAWVGVGILGSFGLPGRRRALEPPLDEGAWASLLQAWSAEIGSFDDVALYVRTQRSRKGFIALALDAGRPVAFLKSRPSGDPDLASERAAVEAVTQAGPALFHVPPVLAEVTCAGWTTLAFRPLPPSPHRPLRRAPAEMIAGEIASSLNALKRSSEVPSHWVPCHGDLTPWNLRRLPDGRVSLVDWEDAGWAPPDSDLVLYRATASAVLGEHPGNTSSLEAVDYWSAKLSGRVSEGHRDRALRLATLEALQRMAPTAAG